MPQFKNQGAATVMFEEREGENPIIGDTSIFVKDEVPIEKKVLLTITGCSSHG